MTVTEKIKTIVESVAKSSVVQPEEIGWTKAIDPNTSDDFSYVVYKSMMLDFKSSAVTRFSFQGFLEEVVSTDFWSTTLQPFGLFLGGVDLDSRDFAKVTFLGKESFLQLSQSETGFLSMLVVTKDKSLLSFVKELKKIAKKRKGHSKGRVFGIMRGRHGLTVQEIGHCGAPMKKSHYEDMVVKQIEKVRQNFLLKNPAGRLVIMSGEPGTGKTYLLRHLLCERKLRFLLVQPKMIDRFTDPDFIQQMISFGDGSKKPIVILIEDGDSLLVKRAVDNMSYVSSLLDISDGLHGHILNVRIVITTNAKEEEMDRAIVRDRRLFMHMSIPPLSPGKAEQCFFEISGEKAKQSFTKPTTLAKVYAKASSTINSV